MTGAIKSIQRGTTKGDTMTTTIWQDNHSSLRRHELMTKELGETIPALRANENADDPDDVLAPAKLFCPYNGWRWYVTRVGPADGRVLRPRRGRRARMGLLLARRVGGDHRVRRRPRHRARPLLGAEDRRRDQERALEDGGLAVGGRGCSERQAQKGEDHARGSWNGSDALGSTGGPTRAPLATWRTDEGAEPVEGGDSKAEAEQDGQASEDAGEQTAPPEELKVVVSIRGDRAVIGVQRPSADPHIETFDDHDLPGLAQEVIAVTERARGQVGGHTQAPGLRKTCSGQAPKQA